MSNYQALYLDLFNNVSDAIERLKQAQCEAERKYMDMDEEAPSLKIIQPGADDSKI